VNRSRVKCTDADIVKGVFAPDCTKLIQDFGTHLNGKLHHILPNKYAGVWDTLVGDRSTPWRLIMTRTIQCRELAVELLIDFISVGTIQLWNTWNTNLDM
jgi:hypothetical protein